VPLDARWLAAHGLLYRMRRRACSAARCMIIIAPVVILQSVLAFSLHGAALADRDAAPLGGGRAPTSRRSSRSTRTYPQDRRFDYEQLSRIARDGSTCTRSSVRRRLAAAGPKPFFSLLDGACRDEIRRQIGTAVLDRHRRPLEPHRDPHQARRAVIMRVIATAQSRPTRPTPHLPRCGWSAPPWCCC
jgi:hypothetical protein